MSQYSTAVKQLPPIEERMPCGWCQTLTLVPTLNQYGARCQSCFDAYCLKGSDGAPAGFVTGRRDTPVQRQIREGLMANRPVFGEKA